MRVKVFQDVVSVSSVSGGGGFEHLEADINRFLEERQDIRLVDLKLASHAAPVGDIITNYGVVAALVYEEPSDPAVK